MALWLRYLNIPGYYGYKEAWCDEVINTSELLATQVHELW